MAEYTTHATGPYQNEFLNFIRTNESPQDASKDFRTGIHGLKGFNWKGLRINTFQRTKDEDKNVIDQDSQCSDDQISHGSQAFNDVIHDIDVCGRQSLEHSANAIVDDDDCILISIEDDGIRPINGKCTKGFHEFGGRITDERDSGISVSDESSRTSMTDELLIENNSRAPLDLRDDTKADSSILLTLLTFQDRVKHTADTSNQSLSDMNSAESDSKYQNAVNGSNDSMIGDTMAKTLRTENFLQEIESCLRGNKSILDIANANDLQPIVDGHDTLNTPIQYPSISESAESRTMGFTKPNTKINDIDSPPSRLLNNLSRLAELVAKQKPSPNTIDKTRESDNLDSNMEENVHAIFKSDMVTESSDKGNSSMLFQNHVRYQRHCALCVTKRHACGLKCTDYGKAGSHQCSIESSGGAKRIKRLNRKKKILEKMGTKCNNMKGTKHKKVFNIPKHNQHNHIMCRKNRIMSKVQQHASYSKMLDLLSKHHQSKPNRKILSKSQNKVAADCAIKRNNVPVVANNDDMKFYHSTKSSYGKDFAKGQSLSQALKTIRKSDLVTPPNDETIFCSILDAEYVATLKKANVSHFQCNVCRHISDTILMLYYHFTWEHEAVPTPVDITVW